MHRRTDAAGGAADTLGAPDGVGTRHTRPKMTKKGKALWPDGGHWQKQQKTARYLSFCSGKVNTKSNALFVLPAYDTD
jgi:hypothetical protein